MKKAKKILLIVLGSALILVIAVYYYFRLRWNWIPLPGWTELLASALSMVIPMISWALIWRAVKPEEKITWKKAIPYALLLVWLSWLNGGMPYKIDDKSRAFIDSPSGKNSAVVFTEYYGSRDYYPAKWRLFYKLGYDQNFQSWNSVSVYDDTEAVYSWVDDNTLEFVITDKDGESETKYIRW